MIHSCAARGNERGGVTPADCAVSRRGRDPALGPEIGQVDAEAMDPGRELAIDDLEVRAGQSLPKSIPGLRGRLTDSGFGNSAALGRAAAEASNASHEDDANGRQQGCCQAKGTAASRGARSRVVPRSFGCGAWSPDSGAHRHDKASFILPKRGFPDRTRVMARLRLACLYTAQHFGWMSNGGALGFNCFGLPNSPPSEPAHTRSGSVGISVPGAYPIRSCDKAPCRSMAASSRIPCLRVLGMSCAILPLVEQPCWREQGDGG
jgi:hypothetical protein